MLRKPPQKIIGNPISVKQRRSIGIRMLHSHFGRRIEIAFGRRSTARPDACFHHIFLRHHSTNPAGTEACRYALKRDLPAVAALNNRIHAHFPVHAANLPTSGKSGSHTRTKWNTRKLADKILFIAPQLLKHHPFSWHGGCKRDRNSSSYETLHQNHCLVPRRLGAHRRPR